MAPKGSYEWGGVGVLVGVDVDVVASFVSAGNGDGGVGSGFCCTMVLC